MMPVRLLLLLCATGPVFAKEAPDVDCLVVNLKYVSCTWNKTGIPQVNYTFYSRLNNEQPKSCPHYLSENHVNIGCNQPYDSDYRFAIFRTELRGNGTFEKRHHLKQQVKLNPPTNLTVLSGSDSKLWLYWNYSAPIDSICVKSEVCFRRNNNDCEVSTVSGTQKHWINLSSNSSRYELQVRHKMGDDCGESLFWSDWSEPVVWGSNDITDSNEPMTVWMTVVYVVAAITLILLVMLLLNHERFRIILIPAVPKPSLFPHDVEDLFPFPSGLEEGFKANYNEVACPVLDYVSQSDSVHSDGSAFSATADQTDCPVSIDVSEEETEDEEDPSAPLSSFSSPVSPEEVQNISN